MRFPPFHSLGSLRAFRALQSLRLMTAQPAARLFRRLLLSVAVMAFSGGSALLAQEQEKMVKRWLEPDEHKTANIQAFKKGFNGKEFKSRNSSAFTKEFYGAKKYRGKDFATSDYNAIRRSTLAERKYGAKKADVEGRGNAKQLVKEHETSQYGVKDARDAGKTASSKTHDTREIKWRGSSQDEIDREGPAAMASVQKDGSFRKLETIDDIRKLLNELD